MLKLFKEKELLAINLIVIEGFLYKKLIVLYQNNTILLALLQLCKDSVLRILEYPNDSLMNNEEEHALRCWMILWKMIWGTQFKIVCRAPCKLANMITTVRRRAENFIMNIEKCINIARGVLNNISYQRLRLSRVIIELAHEVSMRMIYIIRLKYHHIMKREVLFLANIVG